MDLWVAAESSVCCQDASSLAAFVKALSKDATFVSSARAALSDLTVDPATGGLQRAGAAAHALQPVPTSQLPFVAVTCCSLASYELVPKVLSCPALVPRAQWQRHWSRPLLLSAANEASRDLQETPHAAPSTTPPRPQSPTEDQASLPYPAVLQQALAAISPARTENREFERDAEASRDVSGQGPAESEAWGSADTDDSVVLSHAAACLVISRCLEGCAARVAPQQGLKQGFTAGTKRGGGRRGGADASAGVVYPTIEAAQQQRGLAYVRDVCQSVVSAFPRWGVSCQDEAVATLLPTLLHTAHTTLPAHEYQSLSHLLTAHLLTPHTPTASQPTPATTAHLGASGDTASMQPADVSRRLQWLVALESHVVSGCESGVSGTAVQPAAVHIQATEEDSSIRAQPAGMLVQGTERRSEQVSSAAQPAAAASNVEATQGRSGNSGLLAELLLAGVQHADTHTRARAVHMIQAAQSVLQVPGIDQEQWSAFVSVYRAQEERVLHLVQPVWQSAYPVLWRGVMKEHDTMHMYVGGVLRWASVVLVRACRHPHVSMRTLGLLSLWQLPGPVAQAICQDPQGTAWHTYQDLILTQLHELETDKLIPAWSPALSAQGVSMANRDGISRSDAQVLALRNGLSSCIRTCLQHLPPTFPASPTTFTPTTPTHTSAATVTDFAHDNRIQLVTQLLQTAAQVAQRTHTAALLINAIADALTPNTDTASATGLSDTQTDIGAVGIAAGRAYAPQPAAAAAAHSVAAAAAAAASQPAAAAAHWLPLLHATLARLSCLRPACHMRHVHGALLRFLSVAVSPGCAAADTVDSVCELLAGMDTQAPLELANTLGCGATQGAGGRLGVLAAASQWAAHGAAAAVAAAGPAVRTWLARVLLGDAQSTPHHTTTSTSNTDSTNSAGMSTAETPLGRWLCRLLSPLTHTPQPTHEQPNSDHSQQHSVQSNGEPNHHTAAIDSHSGVSANGDHNHHTHGMQADGGCLTSINSGVGAVTDSLPAVTALMAVLPHLPHSVTAVVTQTLETSVPVCDPVGQQQQGGADVVDVGDGVLHAGAYAACMVCGLCSSPQPAIAPLAVQRVMPRLLSLWQSLTHTTQARQATQSAVLHPVIESNAGAFLAFQAWLTAALSVTATLVPAGMKVLDVTAVSGAKEAGDAFKGTQLQQVAALGRLRVQLDATQDSTHQEHTTQSHTEPHTTENTAISAAEAFLRQVTVAGHSIDTAHSHGVTDGAQQEAAAARAVEQQCALLRAECALLAVRLLKSARGTVGAQLKQCIFAWCLDQLQWVDPTSHTLLCHTYLTLTHHTAPWPTGDTHRTVPQQQEQENGSEALLSGLTETTQNTVQQQEQQDSSSEEMLHQLLRLLPGLARSGSGKTLPASVVPAAVGVFFHPALFTSPSLRHTLDDRLIPWVMSKGGPRLAVAALDHIMSQVLLPNPSLLHTYLPHLSHLLAFSLFSSAPPTSLAALAALRLDPALTLLPRVVVCDALVGLARSHTQDNFIESLVLNLIRIATGGAVNFDPSDHINTHTTDTAATAAQPHTQGTHTNTAAASNAKTRRRDTHTNTKTNTAKAVSVSAYEWLSGREPSTASVANSVRVSCWQAVTVLSPYLSAQTADKVLSVAWQCLSLSHQHANVRPHQQLVVLSLLCGPAAHGTGVEKTLLPALRSYGETKYQVVVSLVLVGLFYVLHVGPYNPHYWPLIQALFPWSLHHRHAVRVPVQVLLHAVLTRNNTDNTTPSPDHSRIETTRAGDTAALQHTDTRPPTDHSSTGAEPTSAAPAHRDTASVQGDGAGTVPLSPDALIEQVAAFLTDNPDIRMLRERQGIAQLQSFNLSYETSIEGVYGVRRKTTDPAPADTHTDQQTGSKGDTTAGKAAGTAAGTAATDDTYAGNDTSAAENAVETDEGGPDGESEITGLTWRVYVRDRLPMDVLSLIPSAVKAVSHQARGHPTPPAHTDQTLTHHQSSHTTAPTAPTDWHSTLHSSTSTQGTESTTGIQQLRPQLAAASIAAARPAAAAAASGGGGGGSSRDNSQLLVLDDVCEMLAAETVSNRQETARENRLVVCASLLDNVPNMAGLCRTCESMGVHSLVLPSKAIAQSDAFKRQSVTSERWLQLSEVTQSDLATYLTEQKALGYTIVGVEQASNSVPLQSYEWPPKAVLLLGNEQNGVPAPLLPLLDVCVEIPMLGYTRSLNAHVSGAMSVWEYTKQRALSGLQ